MACSVGSIIAPILGGELTDKVGYRSTCDIVAGFAFICSIVNFLLVFLPVIRRNRSVVARSQKFEQIEKKEGRTSLNTNSSKNRLFSINSEDDDGVANGEAV